MTLKWLFGSTFLIKSQCKAQNFLLSRMLCDHRLSRPAINFILSWSRCQQILTQRYNPAFIVPSFFPVCHGKWPLSPAWLEPLVAQMDHLKPLWRKLLAKVERTSENLRLQLTVGIPWVSFLLPSSPNTSLTTHPLLPPCLSHYIMHFCVLHPQDRAPL